MSQGRPRPVEWNWCPDAQTIRPTTAAWTQLTVVCKVLNALVVVSSQQPQQCRIQLRWTDSTPRDYSRGGQLWSRRATHGQHEVSYPECDKRCATQVVYQRHVLLCSDGPGLVCTRSSMKYNHIGIFFRQMHSSKYQYSISFKFLLFICLQFVANTSVTRHLSKIANYWTKKWQISLLIYFFWVHDFWWFYKKNNGLPEIKKGSLRPIKAVRKNITSCHLFLPSFPFIDRQFFQSVKIL